MSEAYFLINAMSLDKLAPTMINSWKWSISMVLLLKKSWIMGIYLFLNVEKGVFSLKWNLQIQRSISHSHLYLNRGTSLPTIL